MYHQEITIPVNRNQRNFEEQRKEMITSLESNVSQSKNTQVATRDTFMNDDDLWNGEIQEWVRKSKLEWDDDITRIRKNIFQLEPRDGFDNWNQNSTKTSSFSQKTVTMTTTTSDGKTSTTTQSYQNTSTSDGNGANQIAAAPQRAVLPAAVTNTSTSTDFLKDAYELSSDKHVHFKVRLDTSDFKPEDIEVTALDDKIIIKAKKEIEEGNSTSRREFSRTFTIPPSVDAKNFRCQQTKDGILILEAPIKNQDHMAISIKDGVGMKAVSDQHSTFSNALVKVTGKSGPVVVDDPTYGKKVHLEIKVEPDYEPNDFTVYTDVNKIHIKGRHETRSANSSSWKEFSRYYEVPETLDPMSVSFHLLDGTLVVEAPLLRSV